MTILDHVSDEELWSQTKSLVAIERETTTKVLWHLLEVERRRLFAKRAYSSLFEYAVKELHYSEAAAGRRIAAMRLLRQIPEIEPKLSSGELSLSNAAQVQMFAVAEKKAGRPLAETAKRELVETVTGKTGRQCERILAAASPDSDRLRRPAETVKPVGRNLYEMTFTVDEALMEKLNTLKARHSNRASSWAELIALLADEKLEKHAREDGKACEKVHKATTSATSAASTAKTTCHPKTRFTPIQYRRFVRVRADHRCEFTDRMTGRKCGATLRLQLEHVIAFAHGGGNTPEDLRLYCPAHNQLRAIEVYGQEKMAQFIPSLQSLRRRSCGAA